MSNFNALNPIRKAEIIQRRLFGKIKDYLKSNEDDKNKTISELTAFLIGLRALKLLIIYIYNFF